jgi:hypothetical protein
MSKQFSKGQRVRIVRKSDNHVYWSKHMTPFLGAVGTIQEVRELWCEVVADGDPDSAAWCYEFNSLEIAKEAAEEQPKTEVRVRPVYQDGSMSVGATFPNEAEAKAYVERSGVVGVKYEFIPQVVSATYEVKETTTRTVEAA